MGYINHQQRVIYEAELLSLSYEICNRFQKDLNFAKFEMIVTSTEAADLIMEECEIPVEKRPKLLRRIGEMMRASKSFPEMTIALRKEGLIENSGNNMERFK